MAASRVTFTALPNGRGPEGFRLSVAVAIRLGDPSGPADGSLADYPAFEDWPRLLSTLRFGLRTDAGVELGPDDMRPDPETLGKPDSTAWRALLQPDAPVTPFSFDDHSTRGVRTLPVRETVGYAQRLYRDVTRASGTDHAPLGSGPLHDLVGDLGFIRPRLSGRDRDPLDGIPSKPGEELPPARRQPRVVSATARQTPTEAFSQAARFYDRPELAVPVGYGPPDVALVTRPERPEFDVHAALAGLADSPTLMRVFGLALDLLLPDVPDGEFLHLVPEWTEGRPSDVVDATPWTAYQLRPFLTRARDEHMVVDGMLRLTGVDDDLINLDKLEQRRYDLVQVDPDGTALKLVHFADTGRRILTGTATQDMAYDTPQEAGLPGLQTAGLALVEHRRDLAAAQATIDSAVRQDLPVRGAKDLAGAPRHDDVVLYAEDVRRGYRLDVSDLTGPDQQWHSVCRREGTWRVRDHVVSTPERGEEGYVKDAPATAQGGPDSDLYVGESLARWTGWSLVAPRPGRTIVGEPGADGSVPTQSEHVADPAPDLDPNFPVAPALRPARGSLPALRHGHEYRVRLRLVDLAGNSVDDGGEDLATEAVPYQRFEPVLPPTLVPQAEYREGASLERMVIRSDRGVLPAPYATANPGRPGEQPLLPTDTRHVTPPKAAELTVELAGLLDDAFRPGGDPHAAYELAVREAHTLSARRTVDPADLDRILTEPLPGARTVPGRDPLGTGDPKGDYLVIETDDAEIAFLPDPWAVGSALHVERPEPGWTSSWQLPWERLDGDWHRPRAYRLVIGDPAEVAPTPDAATGELVVALPQAEIMVVRYSSLPEAGRVLRESGVWRWADDETLLAPLREGRLWPVSPYRILTLVHAVQRPLAETTLHQIRPYRVVGWTRAELPATIRIDIKSTGTMDLDALWTDWFDGGPEGTLTPPGRSHVAQLDVDRSIAPPGPAPQLSDFPLTAHGPVRDLVAARSKPPVVHEFGDTRHRLVTYRTRGTTPFREYFPPAIAQDPEAISSSWVEAAPVHVPSASRPAAPKPRYAVPIWRWEPADEVAAGWEGRADRVRRGGGVRVWMDRPWWSSGEDELLGVVMREGAAQDVDDRLVPYVTRLGRDPFWDVPAPDTRLRPTDLANRHPLGVATGLRLSEVDDDALAVSVAAVAPTFDPERGLWYADLELPAKANQSYMPFVRLALARYQPYSIPGQELSRVVVVDPVQLLPDRRLRLDRVTGGVDVSLTGPAPAQNAVRVTLQVHDGRTPGELGWTPVAGTKDRPNPLWLTDAPPPGWQLPDAVLERLRGLRWEVPDLPGPVDPGPLFDPARAIGAQLSTGPATRIVLDRPTSHQLPMVGRFLATEQLDALRDVAVPSRERPAQQLTSLIASLPPTFAAPVGVRSEPQVGVADVLSVYGDVLTPDDLRLDQPFLPSRVLPGWRTWQGRVPVPVDGRDYRLVVEELEYAETDDVLATVPILGTDVMVLGSRVVYADMVRV